MLSKNASTVSGLAGFSRLDRGEDPVSTTSSFSGIA